MSPTGARRQPNKTARMRRAAVRHAATLGPIVAVEPAGGRHPADGSPIVGPGQAYVTPTGETFHRAWCGTIGRQWDERPETVKVVDVATVGARRPCRDCEVV